MATLKYVLGNYIKEDGKRQVYLQYIHNEKKTWFATKINIDPKAFQSKRQIVKHTSLHPNLSPDDKLFKEYERLDKAINKELELKRIELLNIIMERKEENLPIDIKSMKSIIENGSTSGKKNSTLFEDALDKYTEENSLGKNTLTGYKSTKKKIEDYSNHKGLTDITVGYFSQANNLDAFRKWLELKIKKESAGKYIKNIKAVLNYTFQDKGSFETVKTSRNKAGSDHTEWLSYDELVKMEAFEDKSKPELMNIKRIFIFLATTGLRISDAKKVIKASGDLRDCFHYLNGKPYLKITTTKTKDNVTVPLSKLGIKNLEKCNYQLDLKSEGYFNRALKKLIALEELGFERKIIKIEHDKSVKEFRSQRFSSKSGKVSFVMMLLESGLSDNEVCNITGNTLGTIQHYKRMRPDTNFKTIEKMEDYWLNQG